MRPRAGPRLAERPSSRALAAECGAAAAGRTLCAEAPSVCRVSLPQPRWWAAVVLNRPPPARRPARCRDCGRTAADSSSQPHTATPRTHQQPAPRTGGDSEALLVNNHGQYPHHSFYKCPECPAWSGTVCWWPVLLVRAGGGESCVAASPREQGW